MHGDTLFSYLYGNADFLNSEDVPSYGRRAILDTLGCSLFGSDRPWVRMTGELVDQRAGTSASVSGRGRVEASAAALVNATAAHGFELDDYVEGCLVHPGAVVVPAVLATAEEVGADGATALRGIVAGYELMARLGLGMGPLRGDLGMHYTGQLGGPAAAIACGIVRGFDLDQLRNAVGIAASMGGGIKAFTQGTGGMVKRLHAGRASEAGVIAAALTAKGFSGPLQALDGPCGILQALGGPDADASHLTDGLGDELMIARNWVKMYPCCAVLHAGAQAVEELVAENSLSLDDIASVRIGGHERMVTQNSGRAITDIMAAQYSMPFVAAAALLGEARDPAAYRSDRAEDPVFQRAMGLVTVDPDPEVQAVYPRQFGARVEIRTTGGQAFDRQIMRPIGSAFSKVGDAEVEDKVHRLVDGILGRPLTDELVERVFAIGPGTTFDGIGRILANRQRPTTHETGKDALLSEATQ